MPKQLTDEQFRRKAVEALLVGAIENGVIDPDGKNDEELRNAFCEYLQVIVDAPEEVNGIHDHMPDLLKRAKREKANKNYLYAAVYYATWVEHWINWHLRCLAVRQGNLRDQEIRQMNRDVNTRGKLTWVLALLGGKRIAEKHINAIQRVSDQRNAFIHFKFPEWRIDDIDLTPEDLKKAVLNFDGTVTYLQNYDRKTLKSVVKSKIRAFAKER